MASATEICTEIVTVEMEHFADNNTKLENEINAELSGNGVEVENLSLDELNEQLDKENFTFDEIDNFDNQDDN